MAVDTLARAIAAGKVPVSAYEMAVAGGYTGTLEEFEADMGNSGTNATNAAASASAAAASAESIAASAAQIETNKSDIADLKEFQTDVEENYARTDGYYDEMAVGSAEQLISTVLTTDQEPYQFRTSGGSADIGNRETDKLVGGTVVWNQTIKNGNFQNEDDWAVTDGVLIITNGAATVTYEAGSRPKLYQNIYRHSGATKSGHVYLILCDISDTNTGSIRICLSSSEAGGSVSKSVNAVATKKTVGVFLKSSSQLNYCVIGYPNVYIYATPAAGSFTVDNVNVIDLTAMFGSAIADYVYSLEQATAGAGVAWFRKLFPKDYYEYDAGTLKSVEGVSAHETVGFNAYDPTAGTAKVVGGMQYQITGAYTALSLDGETVTPDSSGLFTPAKSGILTVTGGNGTTTCVHLVWSGYRNGEYEEYSKHSYPLDSSLTLRGIPRLDANNNLYYDGDTYESDGTVTRKYGIVDLGTLTWVVMTNYQYGTFTAQSGLPGAKYSATEILFVQNSQYTSVTNRLATASGDKYIWLRSVNTNDVRVIVKDTAKAEMTAAEFKAAMSGVYMVYEKATPTTETAEAYTNPQIVDDFGTEEYVTTSIVPVGHYTEYQANLRDKLQHLPDLADEDGYYLIQQSGHQMSLAATHSPADYTALAEDVEELGDKVTDLESAMDILYGETELPWSAIQEMENKGIAEKYLPVGTQLTEPWKLSASSEALTSVWDVVHHTADEMTLNWHYALPEGVQYDAPEAVYYVGSGGLAAGTYHIDIGASYGTGWVAGQSIQFTLASACDEDDQIVISLGSSNETNPTNSRTVSVYAKGSATAKQTATTSNGTGGTSLGTIGAESAQKTNGQFNAISRAVYGSGRWSESAIRQYLNSTADAGAWWEPKNPWDRPPTQHTTLRGFLAGYSEEFLAAIATTDVVTALNTVEGFSATTEVTQDKIFLPCLSNWYITPQLAGEGDAWSYYEALAQEAGISGKFKTGSTYPILIKYRLDTPSSPVGVWLRSCTRSNAGNAWYVTSTGNVYYNDAHHAYRGCPACKIVKSV